MISRSQAGMCIKENTVCVSEWERHRAKSVDWQAWQARYKSFFVAIACAKQASQKQSCMQCLVAAYTQ